ncbi:transposase [Streptomyces sp. NPDC127068]|uniref:transposase n=1 Tax=Streptomyces sp. NPDC127068 TaxID=3347127 RepID=UPI003652F1CC
MAQAASGGAGRAWRQGRAGLDVRDRRCCLGACEKGGSLTGPNPVDRGRKGSKLHVLSEAQGLPLAVAVSGANLHDSQAFKPLFLGIPAVRSRRGPRRRKLVKIRADKAYVPLRGAPPLAPRPPSHREDRPSQYRVRRAARSAPLEDRAVHHLALRPPPPHRPVRTKGQPLPCLPRPRRSPDLLQETRETHHVRHPLRTPNEMIFEVVGSLGER